jgi:hypothetical protein
LRPPDFISDQGADMKAKRNRPTDKYRGKTDIGKKIACEAGR